jgi:succinyl-CoA:acetate CoA-transferase
MLKRIKNKDLLNKVQDIYTAAQLVEHNMVVGCSGFTKAGDSKAILAAVADRAQSQPLKITLITGASLGHDTDAHLVNNGVLARRMPFQVDPVLRKAINKGDVLFIDQHLSETAELLQNKHLPPIDIAIIEASSITEEGYIVPTTSVGNSYTFAQEAAKIIIEINTAVPEFIAGIHDIHSSNTYPNKLPFDIAQANDRMGDAYIKIDPSKIAAIVFTDIPDSPALIADPDEHTMAISKHILTFLEEEVNKGHLPANLLPLQAGIGKIANAVMMGFINSPFEDLTMYSEVLQDSTFALMDAGKMKFASASSITVTKAYYDTIFQHFDKYKDKIVLRPQNISNAPEIIRRLGVIAINTAIEFDIYGNVNSTHTGGSNMMNGIGGSGDFARNAYLSIFVAPSASKSNTISHIVPMVSHVDHTEHDVDILVTEHGLADLRGLAPRERALAIIMHCAHPAYRPQLWAYFEEAKATVGGHTPHMLAKAFDMHIRLKHSGSMLVDEDA